MKKRIHISFVPLAVCLGFLLGLLFGFMRASAWLDNQKSLGAYYDKDIIISGVLESDSVNKNHQSRFQLGNLHLNNSISINDCQVYVMLADEQSYTRSDRITLRGKLQVGFGDYAGFIWRPTIISVEKSNPPDFSQIIRRAFSNRIGQLFDEQESALALGYLVGEKSGMSEELQAAIRIVGLSHMVVVSGYHLGLIVGLVKRIFRKVSRAAIIIGSSVIVLFFVSISGMSASMMRASLMTLLSLFAWYFGRKFHPVRLLIYVAAISLISAPRQMFSVAWQLSFASYAGIIFIAPVLMQFLYGKKRKPGYIASSIIASISAQMCCLPISIYSFGAVSLVGILAILTTSPTIPIIMLLTTLGAIIPPVAFLAKPLIDFNLFIISTFSQNSWAVFDLPVNDPRIFLVYIPVIIIFIWLKRRTKYDFRPRYTLEKSREYGKIYSC